MLAALKRLADRLETEGTLLPPNYKFKYPAWFLNFDKEGYSFLGLSGPFVKSDYSSGVKAVCAPDRQRSGSKPQPFLLVDQAIYVFGIARKGEEEQANRRHQDYLDLLKEAFNRTRLPYLAAIYDFLNSKNFSSLFEIDKIEPDQIIAFKIGEKDPCLDSEIIEFWNSYLEENAAASNGVCLVCGNETQVLRILPREIIILGQKCAISSFNESAYLSYGKQQTENAPICFACASKIINALDYLTKDPSAESHRRIIARNPKKPEHNQIAVFWLKERQDVQLRNAGKVSFSLEEILGAVLTEEGTLEPTAELSQLEELLAIPWRGSDIPLELPDNRFYLALLSANKARMVLRAWIDVSLDVIKSKLKRYIMSTRIIDPFGDNIRAFSVPEIINSLGVADANVIRKLIRSAFEGYPPPTSLLIVALQKLNNPAIFNSLIYEDVSQLHATMAALKLILYFREDEEVLKIMELLDPKRKNVAYQCGRLLAILEEAQRRASSIKLNRTLVDGFYAAASSSPSSYLGMLLNRSHASHLTKLRKENRGYIKITELLEDVLSQIDNEGGFPVRLNPMEQAEFALGFYHQRADFRKERKTSKDIVDSSEVST